MSKPPTFWIERKGNIIELFIGEESVGLFDTRHAIGMHVENLFKTIAKKIDVKVKEI